MHINSMKDKLAPRIIDFKVEFFFYMEDVQKNDCLSILLIEHCHNPMLHIMVTISSPFPIYDIHLDMFLLIIL